MRACARARFHIGQAPRPAGGRHAGARACHAARRHAAGRRRRRGCAAPSPGPARPCSPLFFGYLAGEVLPAAMRAADSEAKRTRALSCRATRRPLEDCAAAAPACRMPPAPCRPAPCCARARSSELGRPAGRERTPSWPQPPHPHPARQPGRRVACRAGEDTETAPAWQLAQAPAIEAFWQARGPRVRPRQAAPYPTLSLPCNSHVPRSLFKPPRCLFCPNGQDLCMLARRLKCLSTADVCVLGTVTAAPGGAANVCRILSTSASVPALLTEARCVGPGPADSWRAHRQPALH